MSIDPVQLQQMVRERMDIHREVFEAGRKEGYRQGFSDGVAETKKVVEATFGQLIKDKT